LTGRKTSLTLVGNDGPVAVTAHEGLAEGEAGMPVGESARNPLEPADLRRRRARRAGITAGVGSLLASLVVQMWAKAVPPSTVADIVYLLAQSVMVGCIAIGYVVYVRRASAPGLVLWLRRFRPGYGDRIRFHRALGAACFGFGSPVTLQDASFSSSLMSASMRLWFLAPLFLVLWLAGVVVVLFLLLMAGLTSGSAVVLGMLAWTALLGWVMLRVLRYRGVLSRELSVTQLARHFDAVRRGERRVGHGVEVIKVARPLEKQNGLWAGGQDAEEKWKKVVREALSRAGLVVIDVSEINSNIEWEIRQVFDRLWPHRILLVAAQGSVSSDGLRDQLAGIGVPAVTVPWIEASLVLYPATQATLLARNTQYDDLVRRLRQAIAPRAGSR